MTHSNFNSVQRPTAQESQFEIYQLNCNGLRGKVSELKIYIYTKKPEIVCLCETWLKKNEPKFHGYQSLWLHRIGEKGGLGILVREDVTFKPKQVIPFPAGLLECQSIEIYTNSDSINILNVYNPCKNIPLEELQHYTNQLGNSFILIGDLNGHSPLWDSRNRYNLTGRSIEKLIETHNLILLNDADTPTYIDNRTGSTSCLDLCITTHDLGVLGELHRGSDIGSDHFPLEITFGFGCAKQSIGPRKNWALKRANWKKWTTLFQQNSQILTDMHFPLDVETHNHSITNKIIEIAKECIPRTSGTRQLNRKTPWWDQECEAAVENRRKAKNKLWSRPTLSNLIHYKRCVAVAKHLALKKKRESWTKFTESLGSTTATSKVWRTIKSIGGKQCSRSFPIGKHTAPNQEIAELFLEHFTSGFASSDDQATNSEVIDRVESFVAHAVETQCLEISFYELHKSIQTLRNTSPGKDLIANIFLSRSPDYSKNGASQPVQYQLFQRNSHNCLEAGRHLPNFKARQGSKPGQILQTHNIAVIHWQTHGKDCTKNDGTPN